MSSVLLINNSQACPQWSSWGDYGVCSVSCGNGTQQRSRACDGGVPGIECLGENMSNRHCYLKKCPHWSEWSDFDRCSATCGTGIPVSRLVAAAAKTVFPAETVKVLSRMSEHVTTTNVQNGQHG